MVRYFVSLWLMFLTNVILSQKLFLEGYAQGTTYHITYFDSKNRNFQLEIDSILEAFDQSVSTYQQHSIISRINRNEPNVKIDHFFKTCFLTAKKIWKSTNGAFDPTVYPLVNLWGFGPEKKNVAERDKVDSVLNFVGLSRIILVGNQIIKQDSRVSLDFNAFAQGYSVDVISNFLNQKNIRDYIVEIGGEVYAKGIQKEVASNWIVGIEKPIDNKNSENPLEVLIKLHNMSVATSGNYRKYFIENGVKYAHHIDPRTGYPTKNNLLSATVISTHCIVSDATATGLLVMGLDKAIIYLKKHPKLQAYLIYSDSKGELQTFQTKKMKKLIIDGE